MTIDTTTLQTKIEQYFTAGADAIGDRAAMDAFLELRSALSEGRVRAAEPDAASSLGWRVNAWVKQGILLGFRLGTLQKMGGDEFSFVDKNTYPARRFGLEEGVRVVPGGSTVREGAYPRSRSGMHAADVCECRRLRGRRHDGRFPRIGRQLCPNREAGALKCRGADRWGLGAG